MVGIPKIQMVPMRALQQLPKKLPAISRGKLFFSQDDSNLPAIKPSISLDPFLTNSLPMPYRISKDDSYSMPENNTFSRQRRAFGKSPSASTLEGATPLRGLSAIRYKSPNGFYNHQPHRKLNTSSLVKLGILSSIAVGTGDPVGTMAGALTAASMTMLFGPVIVPLSRVLNSKESINISGVISDLMKINKDSSLATPDLDKFLDVTKLPKESGVKLFNELASFCVNPDVKRLALNRSLVYGIQQPLKKFFGSEFNLSSRDANLATAAFGTLLEQILLFSADAKLGYASLGPIKTFSNRLTGYLDRNGSESNLSAFLEKNQVSLRALYDLSKNNSELSYKSFLKSEDVKVVLMEELLKIGFDQQVASSQIVSFLDKVETLSDTSNYFVNKYGKENENLSPILNMMDQVSHSLSIQREVFRGVQYSSLRDFIQGISLISLNSDTPLLYRFGINYLAGSVTTPANNLMLASRKNGGISIAEAKDLLMSGDAFNNLWARLLVTTTPTAAIFLTRTEILETLPVLKQMTFEAAEKSKGVIEDMVKEPSTSSEERIVLEALKGMVDAYLNYASKPN